METFNIVKLRSRSCVVVMCWDDYKTKHKLSIYVRSVCVCVCAQKENVYLIRDIHNMLPEFKCETYPFSLKIWAQTMCIRFVV